MYIFSIPRFTFDHDGIALMSLRMGECSPKGAPPVLTSHMKRTAEKYMYRSDSSSKTFCECIADGGMTSSFPMSCAEPKRNTRQWKSSSDHTP